MAHADVIFRGNASTVASASREASTSVASVGRSAKGTEAQLAGARREADSFGKSIGRIAGLTIGTLGAAELIHGIKGSINAAGDLEKQQRKIIRVFGDTPAVLEAFEKTAAKAYGVSHLAALKAASSTGALLTNLGVGPKAAAGMSVGILKLSADIASFNNLPTATVADRVNKALLGQTRGLKSLGISLSQSDVNAKALAIGLVKPVKSADALTASTDRVRVAQEKYGLAVRDHGKNSKEALSAEASLITADKARTKSLDGIVPKLTAQQQAVATLALIYERSKKQQGDFGRNSETLANQQKTLDAEFSNLSDRLGKDLTPAMKAFVEFMAGPGITAAGNFLTTVETDSRKVYAAVRPLAPAAKAAADGFSAIAHQDGVIPTIVGFAAAYKGTTLALNAGRSAYLSAAGAIGNLASPFARVATAASEAGNVMVGAGFTGQIVSAGSVAEKEAPAFLGLANPIGAIATVAALAVGGLVLLATTTENAGEKARKARDDFLGLADAVNKVKGTKLDVQQARLDVSTARQAIKTFSPTLISARAAASQQFPDTAAGDRAAAAAKDHLSTALLRNNQLYLDLARSKQRLTDSTAAESKAETDQKRQVDKTASAFDGLRKKLVDQAAASAPAALRGGHVEETLREQASAAQSFAKQIGALTGRTKDLSPAQRTAIGLIKNFISETGKIPDKKTFRLLVNDAASGKIAAVRRDLDSLPTTKQITVAVSERLSHPFTPPNPINPTQASAGGDVISRPTVALVGEEAPAHPEFIIPTNPARRGRALDLINQMRSWIPGFAGGAGPSPHIRSLEAAGIAGTPAKTTTKSGTRSSGGSGGSSAKKDNRPAWLKQLEANGLPGEKAWGVQHARLDSNLADAQATAPQSDDVRATHALIKGSTRRLGQLRAFRSQHTDSGEWQQAVSSAITSTDNDLVSYRSSLGDLAKKLSPDDVDVPIPTSIKWAIERATFSDSLSDDTSAQKAKRNWLKQKLAEKHGSGKLKGKHVLTGATRIAYQRELTRTNAELGSIAQSVSDQAQADADKADQDAGTPPDLPIEVQQALADASLTPGTDDDLAALRLQESTIQGQLAAATDPRVRVALTNDLASVQDAITSITNGPEASTSPDQQAINDQLQNRLNVATRSAALSEAEVATFGSSGDIGTGRFSTAFDAARGGPTVVIQALHPGDPSVLAAIANATTQAFGQQPSVQSNRDRIAI